MKSKTRRFILKVTNPYVEIPYLGADYFLGIEFLEYPQFVNKYAVESSGFEIICDSVPITHKLECIHPTTGQIPIRIKFDPLCFGDEEEFQIDILIRIGYSK